MFNIKFIHDNLDKVKQACKHRGKEIDVDKLIDLDKKRKTQGQEIDFLRAEKNKISASPNLTDSQIKTARDIKKRLKNIEDYHRQIQNEINSLVMKIPNIPLVNVPRGNDASANVIIKEKGEKTKFEFKPKDYLEIAERLDLIDIHRAAKVAGSRFGYLKRGAVSLQFALTQMIFDLLIPKKFIPVIPPVMIKNEIMHKMGYIDSEADLAEKYFLKEDNLFLVGTSEQSIGPMYVNEVLRKKLLPQRYIGFSTCFRREAGSYGKDVRGILRVHQFDKLEMFSFCEADKSEIEHQFFLDIEEKIMQLLQIPYRVVHLCTGEIPHPSASTFDVEAWLPGQNRYFETHSCSNCTDFQARRLNIRYQDSANKLTFVYTINGTACAMGRMLVAILENYQQKDGSIKVPKVLQKYCGFKKIK
jgi:seryl-tRNA synthetase